MNRRSFLTSLFAAPVVAMLPDVRRASVWERVKERASEFIFIAIPQAPPGTIVRRLYRSINPVEPR